MANISKIKVANQVYDIRDDSKYTKPATGIPASDIEPGVIPVVNNGTLTMQVNGTTKQTFTANQSDAATFNVTAADLGLTSAMVFVGVSTTDPKGSTGATVSGHTTWKKGEVVLYGSKEFVLTADSNVAANWTELGDEGSHALKSITITGTGVLSGGGSLEANRTITHNTSGATAGSYGDSSAQTPAYGGTFKVPYVTVNDTGHVTGISEHTVKIPASDNTNQTVKGAGSTFGANAAVDIVAGSNVTVTPDTTNNKITIAATDTKYSAATTSAAGLMSAADKTKLNGIATGATAVSESTVSGWGFTKNTGNAIAANGTATRPVYISATDVATPCTYGFGIDSTGPYIESF